MFFYKTSSTPEGQQLACSLADIRREGLECEAQALAFASLVGAESFIPAVGSEYGGVSALVFPRDTVHTHLFDIDKQFKPISRDDGQAFTATNGTPYFALNYTLKEEAMRYDRAQRMRNRMDIIASNGRLKLSAVVNMMSRTQIIKEAFNRRPKFSNEFQILNGNGKFIYSRAKQQASEMGREHLDTWLDTYSKLRTKADWRNMFPYNLTSGDYVQLVKSREELSSALHALENKDWSIVVTIIPGEEVRSQAARNNVIRLARQIYSLPVIHFGTTHDTLLAALPSNGQASRPATFRIGDTEYVQIREEAKAEGLEPITAEEYQQALDSIKGE